MSPPTVNLRTRFNALETCSLEYPWERKVVMISRSLRPAAASLWTSSTGMRSGGASAISQTPHRRHAREIHTITF